MEHARIKVIVKEPGEPYGHVEVIQNDLRTFQHCVGGPIEVIERDGVAIVCHEEGKLLGLAGNFRCPGDVIAGTAVMCGVEGEWMTDVPVSMDEWKALLDKWGRGGMT